MATHRASRTAGAMPGWPKSESGTKYVARKMLNREKNAKKKPFPVDSFLSFA
jgi:hypothetical protein